MCSLCGVLAGRGHWTDSAAHPDAFRSRAAPHTRQRERQERTRLANAVLAHYKLRLADWSATSYVLRGPTGRSVIVENLSEVWAAAETLLGRSCDPLDEALLADLDRAE